MEIPVLIGLYCCMCYCHCNIFFEHYMAEKCLLLSLNLYKMLKFFKIISWLVFFWGGVGELKKMAYAYAKTNKHKKFPRLCIILFDFDDEILFS